MDGCRCFAVVGGSFCVEKYYLACELLDGRSGHVAGRELLHRLYHTVTGGELPPIVVSRRGKPDFAEGGWHFSISHTPRRVFCVLATCNVAVDAEETDRQVNLRLADKILSPGERAQFDAAPDQRTALLTFWVLKEAAAKLSGEGLRGYPRETDFSLDHPGVLWRDGCVVAVFTEESQGGIRDVV